MENHEINLRITRLLHRCTSLIHTRMEGGRTTQASVLRLLHIHGPMTQKQLQKELGIRQSSLSEVVSKLEENNLLTRKRLETDRRIVLLDLTETGLANTLQHRQRAQNESAELLSCFTEDEKQDILHLLEKLYDSMEEKK